MIKKRKNRLGLLLTATFLICIVIIWRIFNLVDSNNPRLLIERQKRNIPVLNVLLYENSDIVEIIINLRNKVEDFNTNYTIFYEDNDFIIMYSDETKYSPYYRNGKYLVELTPYVFQHDEIFALERFLTVLDDYGYKQALVVVNKNEIRVHIQETHRSICYLTTNDNELDVTDSYYFEETEYGFNIEIHFIPR